MAHNRSLTIREVEDGYLIFMPYCEATKEFIADLKPVIPYGRGRLWKKKDKCWWISRPWWGGVCNFLDIHFGTDRTPRADLPAIELLAEESEWDPIKERTEPNEKDTDIPVRAAPATNPGQINGRNPVIIQPGLEDG